MSKIDTIIARLCRRVKVGQIFNWLKFKAHRHDWETVAENRWCLPTRQICTCGAKREVETHPDRRLYRWKYSDGSCGPWLRMTDGQPACIKMVGCGTAYRLPGAGRQPLYTSPQPSKPLTDAQIGAVAADIWGSILIAPQSYQAFARAIEAAHGITGETK